MRFLRKFNNAKVIAASTVAAVLLHWFFWGGAMFSSGPLKEGNRKGISRGGVSSHAEIKGNCAACHASPMSSQTMEDRCLVCHTEIRQENQTQGPLHGRMPQELSCRDCHTEHQGAHGNLTNLARFKHDWAAFQLTGQHQTLDCKACHVDNLFKGTPQTCVSCHAEPAVHKGRFGTECIACHATSTWKGAAVVPGVSKFDHNLTNFKLTGKHQTVDCKSCHVGGVFKGASSTCASCHNEPVVHKGRFGVECASCHTTTTWKGAVINPSVTKFDHNLAAFKLTGKHLTVDCKACHVESFKGTPQTCVACHAEPPAPKVHKYRYGTNCVQCHATTTWKGADFKHTFPINHGSRRGKGATGNTCATCHANSLNFKVYTCYNCHQHQQAKIERIHLQRRIKDFQDCARCHKTGRGGERRGALDTGELNRWLAAATDLNAVSSEVALLNYFRSTVQAENPLATKCNQTPEGMLRGNCPAAAP